jgi:hypothetical protein
LELDLNWRQSAVNLQPNNHTRRGWQGGGGTHLNCDASLLLEPCFEGLNISTVVLVDACLYSSQTHAYSPRQHTHHGTYSPFRRTCRGEWLRLSPVAPHLRGEERSVQRRQAEAESGGRRGGRGQMAEGGCEAQSCDHERLEEAATCERAVCPYFRATTRK